MNVIDLTFEANTVFDNTATDTPQDTPQATSQDTSQATSQATSQDTLADLKALVAAAQRLSSEASRIGGTLPASSGVLLSAAVRLSCEASSLAAVAGLLASSPTARAGALAFPSAVAAPVTDDAAEMFNMLGDAVEEAAAAPPRTMVPATKGLHTTPEAVAAEMAMARALDAVPCSLDDSESESDSDSEEDSLPPPVVGQKRPPPTDTDTDAPAPAPKRIRIRDRVKKFGGQFTKWGGESDTVYRGTVRHSDDTQQSCHLRFSNGQLQVSRHADMSSHEVVDTTGQTIRLLRNGTLYVPTLAHGTLSFAKLSS